MPYITILLRVKPSSSIHYTIKIKASDTIIIKKITRIINKKSTSCNKRGLVVVATMDQEVEEKERQQIKEWHNRVFKDIKKYDCLSKEDIQRFKVKNS